jgi:hypothetical protein
MLAKQLQSELNRYSSFITKFLRNELINAGKRSQPIFCKGFKASTFVDMSSSPVISSDSESSEKYDSKSHDFLELSCLRTRWIQSCKAATTGRDGCVGCAKRHCA